MDKHIITKEQAEQIIKEVFTIADFCRKVGWQPRGENYRVFYKYVKDYNLDISHFTRKKSNLDNKNNIGTIIPAIFILPFHNLIQKIL